MMLCEVHSQTDNLLHEASVLEGKGDKRTREEDGRLVQVRRYLRRLWQRPMKAKRLRRKIARLERALFPGPTKES